MKKYKITFTDDYCKYEEWAGWLEEIEENPEKFKICKKWKGKSITILELEDFVKEVGKVVFNGDTIEVYNGDREYRG